MLKSGAEEWIFLKKLSGGRSTKKIFAQGKIEWKENHESQLTLDRIHATA